jgi:AAA+ ATPase superfamily predicted ATPase
MLVYKLTVILMLMLSHFNSLYGGGGYFHGFEITSDSKLFEIHNHTIIKGNKTSSIYLHAKVVKKALRTIVSIHFEKKNS